MRRAVIRAGCVSGVVLVLLAVVARSAGSAGRSASNRARAKSEASRLLSLLRLPANAVRSAGEPAGDRGLLASPTYDEATPNLVDAHAWWTVPGGASDVLAYVKAHLPAGARPYVIAAGGNLAPGFAYDAFALSPIPGALSERVLGVTVLQASAGTAAVRTDGEAVWITPRPSWERIPSGVQRVTFLARQVALGDQSRPAAVRGELTGRSARRLVRFINQMRLEQPGVRSCPGAPGALVRLWFYGSSRTLVARAVEHTGGCPELTLTIGRRAGPPLDDYTSVSDELTRLGALRQTSL